MYELTVDSFDRVIRQNKTVLVEFYADWCTSCEQFGEFLDQVNNDYPDVVFAKVNVGTEPEIAEGFSICSLPSLFCFHEGQIYAQEEDTVSLDRIHTMIPAS